MTTFSPEQHAALDYISSRQGNTIISAVAGSGKTTTILEASKRSPSPALFAFNKKIADELRAKGAPAGTFHSFGLKICGARFAKWPKIDAKGKGQRLCEKFSVGFDEKYFILDTLSFAKQAGLSPDASFDQLQEVIDLYALDDQLREGLEAQDFLPKISQMLKASATTVDVIDFDDMLWLPLVHGLSPQERFSTLFIDEAQDTNGARRALAKKFLQKDGLLVAVGDPHQAIYGFAGATPDAMEKIRDEFSCTTLPLHTSFRCGQEIIAEAQRYVSHIKAFHANPPGQVNSISSCESVLPGDVILCRNTRPLLSLAFGFLQQGKGVKVEGRQIGEGLKALARKFRVSTLRALREKVLEHRGGEIKKALEKKQRMKAQSIADKHDSLLTIIDSLPPQAALSELLSRIDSMFADTQDGKANLITLSTIHRFKGRESNTVFWYGPDEYQPSPYATQAWEEQQETNLMYVAATRAKHTLNKVLLKEPKAP